MTKLPNTHNYKINKDLIQQRLSDGYINATSLCKASGKLLGHYLENNTTQEFVKELSSVTLISVTELIQVIQGGTPDLQGTWVHPQVAINLGQWASPKFAVTITQLVMDWINRTTNKEKYTTPYYMKRIALNSHKIPCNYFSMLEQMYVRLFGRLELQGYVIPDNLIPDISLGKIFNNWLRDQGYNPENFPTYTHTFGDGVRPPVKARLYPDEIYVAFKHRLIDWITNHSVKYFKTRDTNIIPYLNKVLKQEAINNQSVTKQLKYRPL